VENKHKYKVGDVVVDKNHGRVIITKLYDEWEWDHLYGNWYNILTGDGRHISTTDKEIERIDLIATMEYKRILSRE